MYDRILSDPMRLYEYQSLERDQIRILELLPDEMHSELHVRLQSYDLEAVPKFEALSYEWGVPVRASTVTSDKG